MAGSRHVQNSSRSLSEFRLSRCRAGKAAYASAGIPIPRTAQTQYNAGPLLPANAPLRPGDLIFYGTPTTVHHVAIYIGQNQILHAPTFGMPVQIAPRDSMSDFVGASRPTADPRAAGDRS